ncbi:MAG: CBS domain-containing protein [Dehalococcoidia bacterium]|nr:MAG: CBS domain-containing protein [Dehalococcoidia bacterium]
MSVAKWVKDIMLPLDDYAIVPEDASMVDAYIAFEEAQKKLPPGLEPSRALLVVDKNEKIIGKVGQLAFLKALEPKYDKVGDLNVLSRAGLTPDFINSMMKNMQLWQESFFDISQRARDTQVKDIMHPVTESIDEDASLGEAIHKIIMYQTLSLLVTRGSRIVGILRISDLFNEIGQQLKTCSTKDTEIAD